MLYSKLSKYKVKTPLGDKVGSLSDFIFNGENWKIDYLVISEGFLKKHKIGVKPEDITIDDEKEEVHVSPEVEHIDVVEKQSSKHKMFYDHFRKKGVMTSDDEKAGKVYDADLYTELKKWEINRFLVDTGWTKHRLRLKTKDIAEVTEKIQIDMTKKDIEQLSKPELPEEYQEEEE